MELWREAAEPFPARGAPSLRSRDPSGTLLPPRGLAPRLDELLEIEQRRAAQAEALRRLSRMAGQLGLGELRDEQRGGQIVSGDGLRQRESREGVRGRVYLVRGRLAEGTLDHRVIVVCIQVGILNRTRCW